MTYLATILADAPTHYWRCADPGGAILFDIGSPAPKHMHLVNNAAISSVGIALGYSGPNSDTGCVDLSLTSLYANTGAVISFPAGAQSFELLAWPFQNLSGAGTLLSYQSGANLFGLFRNGTQWGSIYNNTSCLSSVAYATEAWIHLAGTYDGTSVRLYINGVQQAIAAVAAATAFTSLLTLSSNAAFANWGQAFYSEVALYASALSAGRVAAHYAAIDRLSSVPTWSQAGTPPSGGAGAAPTAAQLAAILAAVQRTY